jgi:hypothetical protein
MAKKNENDVEIRFIVTTDRHDGTDKTFNEGDEHTMNRASANHWIRRNKAITVADHRAAQEAVDVAKQESEDAVGEAEKNSKADAKAAKEKEKADAKAAKKAEKDANK